MCNMYGSRYITDINFTKTTYKQGPGAGFLEYPQSIFWWQAWVGRADM